VVCILDQAAFIYEVIENGGTMVPPFFYSPIVTVVPLCAASIN